MGDLRTLGRLSGLGKEEESDGEDEKARDDKSLERSHDVDYNNLKSIEGYCTGYMCLNGPWGKVELELDAETCQVVFLALSAHHVALGAEKLVGRFAEISGRRNLCWRLLCIIETVH